MIHRYTGWVVNARWYILILMAGLVAMAGYGIKDLQFKSDYRMFFSDDNPQLTALENLQKTYTRDDNVLLVLTPAKGDVFSPEILAIAQRLTKDLWQTPYSTRVDSLVNFQYSHANGDEVTVEDLVGDIAQLTPEDLTRIKLYALQEPLLVNRLVSPNAKVMGFNVVILRPGINQDSETVEVTRYVRKLADSLRAEHPDLDVRITGSILMDTAFAESSELDMRTLTPAMLTIIAVALWFFLRSFWGMVTVLIMMTLAVIATVGMTGWLGIAFSPSSIPAPTILLTLVVANSVHLLTSFYKSVNDGVNPHEAIDNSIAKNFKAIVFCNFTTVIGFLTMNSSESPPFRDLGNITAMGMVITFFLSMVLQPALMAIFPAAGRPRWGSNEGWKKFAHFVIKYRHYCLIGMTLAVAVLATGIRLNALDDEYVKYFDSSVEFRRDTDYTSDHLTGIYRIDYSLEKNNGDGISDPDFLQRVDAFVQWYRQQPEVTHVFAVTDIFKRLNQNMHSDDPAWYRLPETAEMSAQFLLLYEMSLPYGLDLNDRINVNKSATRVSVTLHSISSQQVLDLEARAQAWLKVNAPNFARHEGTGITLLFAHIGQRNIASMIDGLVLAAIIIALTLIAVLRSTLLGLLSLIPNVIPSIMVFGVWGMLVGQIGMASSVVVAMTLGILVDDTVHFLTQYQYARNQKGLPPEAAVEYAFSQIGNALWVTSFILILGFAIFALSSFKINQEMGMLTTLIFAVGLLADFILLPPILLFIEGFRKSAKASSLVEKKAV
ncbi:MAG: efflux RND transporter permease subunit [Nitrosomonas sp.]|nr:MAG: efflux RND transporter permease subunit [Nitrosomonas sp.]